MEVKKETTTTSTNSERSNQKRPNDFSTLLFFFAPRPNSIADNTTQRQQPTFNTKTKIDANKESY